MNTMTAIAPESKHQSQNQVLQLSIYNYCQAAIHSAVVTDGRNAAVCDWHIAANRQIQMATGNTSVCLPSLAISSCLEAIILYPSRCQYNPIMNISNNYQLNGLLKKQAKARQQRALALANQAMAMMREKGIDVRLFGSILTDDFKSHSDVDCLIISCPDEWRYTIILNQLC
jgi:nucleotidyltransferase-like protein